MPQTLTSVENNFTRGLITESTGLNFPENAATETFNCEYTLIGDVIRREGIDAEINGTTRVINSSAQAMSTFVWNNAGGDGNSKLEVKQVGSSLYFYNISAVTTSSPLSQNYISSISIAGNVAAGGTFDITQECEYAAGNGYLFVYHPSCDPAYFTYASGAIAGNVITIQIRDFAGIPEAGVADNLRPLTLTDEHKYNLINQGWVSGNPWTSTSSTVVTGGTGAKTFTIVTGLTVSTGQSVTATGPGGSAGFGAAGHMIGVVTSYNSGTGSLVLSVSTNTVSGTFSSWSLVPTDNGHINTWFSDVGNYPSNSDQWWSFKDASDVFNPTTTLANTTIGSGRAPQGSILFNAFQQQRAALSGIASLTDVTTTVRPRTGCWFQGRVWYSGVDASFATTGDAPFSTWTESIYTSQVVMGTTDFGRCYQTNDPTSETLFGLLPTDGGVITIQGSGSIYKLWPTQNGMLVFANNGIWFITGSQGIGFAMNDYTITKISSIKALSGKSFVDVLGLPFFLNEEGIYQVAPDKNNSLSVEPITVGTILTFYNDIPLASKQYARGSYDPVNYVIQWVYKSTLEVSVTDRYQYDAILNFNTYNKAFYPYIISAGSDTQYIHGVDYIIYPYQGVGIPDPSFKYHYSHGSPASASHGFADEHDTSFVDWGSANYSSYFITGYKVHGQGLMKFQIPYVNIFSRNTSGYTAYYVQGIWDYANTGNSGRFSVKQFMDATDTQHDVNFKRVRIRGRGYTLQLKFTSVDGQPFDLIGWAVFETKNTGV